MRLAAGGELGVGVGEEEWGSGEREVLEDFARRTEGVVDLLVARFGDPPTGSEEGREAEPWMGVGRAPRAADGVVFSGVGAVSRASMRDLAGWLQDVYCYGEAAYGIRESPTSERKRRKQKADVEQPKAAPKAARSPSATHDPPPGIPRPILVAADAALDDATAKLDKKKAAEPARSKSPAPKEQETWKKLLTFGYGTAWGPSEAGEAAPSEADALAAPRVAQHIAFENGGHFVVGVRGDPEDESDELVSDDEAEGGAAGPGRRVRVRTVHVTEHADPPPDPARPADPVARPPADAARRRRWRRSSTPASSPSPEPATAAAGGRTTRRLRLVLYARRPFLLALLLTTSPTPAALVRPRFYRDLHTFLSALAPLVARRSGAEVGARRLLQARQGAPPGGGGEEGRGRSRGWPTAGPAAAREREGVWDVAHDARTLCTRTTMPGIPAPGEDGAAGPGAGGGGAGGGLEPGRRRRACTRRRWRRWWASGSGEAERSVKTGRGWWVVWARMDGDDGHDVRDEGDHGHGDDATTEGEREREVPGEERTGLRRRVGREILLVRRSGEAEQRGKGRVVSGWGSGGHKLEGAKMGIGFDARRYMEGMVMRFGR